MLIFCEGGLSRRAKISNKYYEGSTLELTGIMGNPQEISPKINLVAKIDV
jgi:hypothetical protein